MSRRTRHRSRQKQNYDGDNFELPTHQMSKFAKVEVPSGPVPSFRFHADCIPESAGLSSERLRRLEEWQTEMVRAGRLPCTHLKVLRQGKVVYNRATGYENLSTSRPVREDTIYRMYSMTKPIVVGCMHFGEASWGPSEREQDAHSSLTRHASSHLT